MSRQIDFTKPLSDEDEAYVRQRGNAEDLRLLDGQKDPDFGLAAVPGSMQEWEIKGSGQPTFDLDSKVAVASEGSEPGVHSTVTHVPSPTPPKPVAVGNVEETPKAAPAPKASAKA